jgi:hypothetical protein
LRIGRLYAHNQRVARQSQSPVTSRSFGRFCSASRIAACHFPGRSSKLAASSSASWNSHKFREAHPFHTLRGRPDEPPRITGLTTAFGKTMLPVEKRAIQVRKLARLLEASPPSPERDQLLDRTRRRLAEIEEHEELDPPSSHPALPWPN